ncbi:hypothetical protein Aperf_G00000132488 [Anoplocephala perfoliata]
MVQLNRKVWGYLTVVGAFLFHLSFGYNYTIANMNSYLKPYMGITNGQTVWFHAVVISGQAIGMPVGGILAEKIGYRLVEIIGAVLTTGGVMLSSLTVNHGLGPFIVTYAVMFGIGMGLPYSVLFTLAAEWFPKHRALVIGIILGGLGMGALVFTPFQTALINPHNLSPDDQRVKNNVTTSFLKLGALMIALQVIGFILVKKNVNKADDQLFEETSESDQQNKEDLVERGESKKEDSDKASEISDFTVKPDNVQNIYSYTISESLKTIDFYTVFAIVFINTAPVTLQTSSYKLFGGTKGIDDSYLSTVVMCTAIFNCTGRVIWGLICDYLSYKIPLGIFLVLWAVLYVTFPAIGSLPMGALKPLYTIWVFLLVFSMAGHFVLLPAASARIFGPKYTATIYGFIYLATCPSALILAGITSVNDISNNFDLVYYMCCILCVVSLILSLFLEDKFGKLGGVTRLCVSACNPCRRIPPGARGVAENVLDAITEPDSSAVYDIAQGN